MEDLLRTLREIISCVLFRALRWPDNVRLNAFLGEKEIGEKNLLGIGVRSSLINEKLQKNVKRRL